ncbi:amino acid ABC transporter permease [Aestuariibius insulae]|uniref:amino acid ABC transporter permease n=1 Tax=Aestuariibius insulae TaxID=2058287 RepID=UPI00345E290A
MSDTHAQTVAFVRDTEIPPSPPPASEAGVIKWLRENLFSSISNSILTILGLIAVYYMVVGLGPWLANSIWQSDSLAECREILDGATGACFAVIRERWNQLLFGFRYPSDEYWRPALAFILLFVAILPVLFSNLPRKLLIGTALYPFLAFWLIWGGSVLIPIVALLGFIVGGVAYSMMSARSFVGAVVAAIVAAAVTWWAGGLLLEIGSDFLALRAVPSRDLGGFMLNMILGTVCVSLSLPIGIVLALGRQSNLPIVKVLCVIFIEFVRGVPLITLLFVASVILAYFFPPESNLDLVLRVIIMITMFASAYIAEVIRGGLAALPRGQYEAADSLGLDYAQSMRLIILPQALKISIPGIVNVAVGLFKDTTLVAIISMYDLVGLIRGPILASTDWNGVYWELWSFAALLFFVICYGISQYSQWLERKLATDHR